MDASKYLGRANAKHWKNNDLSTITMNASRPAYKTCIAEKTGLNNAKCRNGDYTQNRNWQ
jgi:hypothetical protein